MRADLAGVLELDAFDFLLVEARGGIADSNLNGLIDSIRLDCFRGFCVGKSQTREGNGVSVGIGIYNGWGLWRN